MRRHLLLDAAVDVVASKGMRGLTHRAVDAQAGFPEGTTSAYLRTRVALMTALAHHVGAKTEADVDRLARALAAHRGDPEFAIAEIAVLVQSWLAERPLLATRLELGIAAARLPEIAESFRPWREHLVDVVADQLDRAGIGDPRPRAVLIVAAIDGLLLASLDVSEQDRAELAAEGTRLVLRPLMGATAPATA
jgi:DNA-binding transcriptional regulator YbjK